MFDARLVKTYLDYLSACLAGTVSFERAQEVLGVDQRTIYALIKEGLLDYPAQVMASA